MRPPDKKTPVRVDNFLAGAATDGGGDTNRWWSTDAGIVAPEKQRFTAAGVGTVSARAGDAPAPAGGPLGIYGKSPSAFIGQRAEKYQLQSAARQLRQGFPVTRCLRWTIPTRHAEILYASEFGRAFYGGLETCGSVWECPVCAAKISERRRVEVQAAMAAHKATGGAVYLLTATNPHYRGDHLPSLLAGQAEAMRRFMSGTRSSRRLFASLGTIGTIRAVEVTQGDNGWHPHFHILLFVPAHLANLEMFRRMFFVEWLNACQLAGLPPPSYQHGITLQSGEYAERYVSKWGLESEITKGHIKKGKAGGRTPFDLLRDYKAGDKQAGALFVEYANAFKGKRQLVWSKGLKAHFAIDELSDTELAEKEEENADKGYEFSREDWGVVLKWDARAEMLQAFENGGPYEVAQCLALLRPETDSPVTYPTEAIGSAADWMGWDAEQTAMFVKYLEECQT